MIEFFFDESDKIIVANHTGTITSEDILQSWIDLNKQYSQSAELNILLDYRNCQAIFPTNILAIQIDEIKRAVVDQLGIYEKAKMASLPGSEENRLLAALYQKLVANIKNYQYEIFDTPQQAIKWLQTR
jgi:energy-converting hydrogenase Eha subunit A